MKTLIILLFPIMLSAQHKPVRDWLTTHNDVAHFYGSVLVNETAYQVSGKLFPEWRPGKRIAFSNVVTLIAISIKERYDMLKANPTGWSWDDFFIGCWAIPVYDIVRICLNDFRKSPNDAYYKNKAPKKWSLKRMGFIRS